MLIKYFNLKSFQYGANNDIINPSIKLDKKQTNCQLCIS